MGNQNTPPRQPIWGMVFNGKESKLFPSILPGDKIPSSLESRKGDPANQSRASTGIATAVSFLLTDRVDISVDGATVTISYESERKGENRCVTSRPAKGQSGGREWVDNVRQNGSGRVWQSTKTPVLLPVIEAALGFGGGGFEETKERFEVLLREVKAESGLPVAGSVLEKTSRLGQVRDAMLALTDSLYYETKQSFENGSRSYEDDLAPFVGNKIGGVEELFDLLGGKEQEQEERNHFEGTGLLKTLASLIETGGTALMVGPTGTLKTTTAKQAALAVENTSLTVLDGNSGVDDRRFFGGVMPSSSGEPQWVDGKLTKAMRKAQEGKSVFLFDELLRVEEYHTSAFIGALNPASTEELSRRGIAPAEGHEDKRHYVLELPNGEVVVAPVENLTMIATTNAGADYVQVGGSRSKRGTIMDAALSGRFELKLEVEEADPQVVASIFEKVGGGEKTAAFLVDLQKRIDAGTFEGGGGGTFVRRANLHLMLNFARHMMRLMGRRPGDGKGEAIEKQKFREAAMQAADQTLAGSVVEREEGSGFLEGGGLDALMDETERSINKALA